MSDVFPTLKFFLKLAKGKRICKVLQNEPTVAENDNLRYTLSTTQFVKGQERSPSAYTLSSTRPIVSRLIIEERDRLEVLGGGEAELG